jgi:hypothetical protein
LNVYCGKPPAALGLGDRDKLVKLLGLLGSNHDGERAAAALKADRHIRSLGLAWGDVIAPLATEQAESPPPPQRWQDICAAVLSSGRATQWESSFCESLLRKWRGPEVTRKQRATLEKMFEKCRGGDHA